MFNKNAIEQETKTITKQFEISIIKTFFLYFLHSIDIVKLIVIILIG